MEWLFTIQEKYFIVITETPIVSLVQCTTATRTNKTMLGIKRQNIKNKRNTTLLPLQNFSARILPVPQAGCREVKERLEGS